MREAFEELSDVPVFFACIGLAIFILKYVKL